MGCGGGAGFCPQENKSRLLKKVMLNAAFGVSTGSGFWEKAGRVGITWWAGPSKKGKIGTDNTVVGTNIPDLKKQDNPQGKTANKENIIDHVNLGKSGSSTSDTSEEQ